MATDHFTANLYLISEKKIKEDYFYNMYNTYNMFYIIEINFIVNTRNK